MHVTVIRGTTTITTVTHNSFSGFLVYIQKKKEKVIETEEGQETPAAGEDKS